MFEKEAEENGFGIGCTVNPTTAFQKGVEFGYNKANEWHYVKNGIMPEENQWVLVYDGKDWTKGFYENGKWNVISLVGFLHIIAWKEIVLPKEIKND